MPTARLLIAVLGAALFLTGCDTTQEKNLRAEISAKRALGSRKPVTVKTENSSVKVEAVQRVGRGKNAVLVVRYKSSAGEDISDAAIAVFAGGKQINRGPNIPWFHNHVPAIAGGKTGVWVARLKGGVPSGRLTARIGESAGIQPAGNVLPEIVATDVTVVRGKVSGSVKNESGLPQYIVEVYVTVERGGKYVSAGHGFVSRLTGSGSKLFVAPLEGRTGGSAPQVTIGPGVLAKPD